jgi:hypothetical protein
LRQMAKHDRLINMEHIHSTVPQDGIEHTITGSLTLRASGRLDFPKAESIPEWLDDILSRLPTNVNRRRGAEEISQYLFPVSHRSLESWQLPTRRVNGQAIVSTRALFALAFQKYSASPVVMGGRRKPAFVK